MLTLSTPPAVAQISTTSLLAGQQSYSYGPDHELVSITHSDGRSIGFAYDSFGRLTTETLGKATLSFGYDAGGTLTSVNRSDSVKVDMTHDGPLWSGSTWSGAISGSVKAEYDANFWLKTLTVNNASSVSFTYDNDGLVIGASSSAGGMTVSRDPNTGMVTGTTLGNVGTTIGYSEFAELNSISIAASGTALFRQSIVREKLGRITQITENVQGVAHDVKYGYDNLGRLTTATRDGVITTYGYDLNGNRTSVQVGSATTVTATFDAQDRSLTQGTTTFEPTPHGDLLRKVDGASSSELSYDELGNLLKVTATSGATTNIIDYVVDGFGRRVARKVGGAFDRAWLYRDSLRPVSEVDSAGTFTHFVYADSQSGAPDFMIRSGVLLRVVKDHLGSVRAIVNAQTGAVLQAIEYDAFGVVLSDTSPGFQPFGFAGGIYDAVTGLVRFGARDYDPSMGRWTNKDPIGFAGGDTNVYAYVGNDPVNLLDPDGLRPLTGREEAFLRAAFGKSLDTSEIDLDAGVWDDAGYNAGGGNIRVPLRMFRNRNTANGLNLSNETVARFLIHEAFHVWQRQRGVWVTSRAFPLQTLRVFGLYNPYAYRRHNSPGQMLDEFQRVNVEAQAAMFENGIAAMLAGRADVLSNYWGIINYVQTH